MVMGAIDRLRTFIESEGQFSMEDTENGLTELVVSLSFDK